VPNPSFNDVIFCPNSGTLFTYAKGWFTNINSADLFHECGSNGWAVPNNLFGFQNPYSGKGYCGIYVLEEPLPGIMEFIGTRLIQPLQIGTRYYISFKISLADHPSINCATNKIGVLFTNTFYKGDTVVINSDTTFHFLTMHSPMPIVNNFAHVYSNYIISDTAGWETISGSFISDSSYQYFLIGRFFDDSSTFINCINSNIKWSYYYIDDVCVSTDSLLCNLPVTYNIRGGEAGIDIFPNPASNIINVKINYQSHESIHYILYNIHGIINKQGYFRYGNNFLIDVSLLEDGIYFLTLKINDNTINKKIIIIKN